MRRLESIEDEMRGTVTYELEGGRYVRFDARTLREYGLKAMMRAHDIEMPTERVPVMQCGRRVGTMAPDFDPFTAKSRSFLYDYRAGDLRREGAVWIAGRTLGASDLDMLVGFVRDEQR